MSILEERIREASTREEILNMPNCWGDRLTEEECIEIKARYIGLSQESVKIMLQAREDIYELNKKRGFSGIGISLEMAMSV